MHRTYWVNTKKYCGAITVDQHGIICRLGTAPCYKWMAGKQFNKTLNYLRYKKYLYNCKKLDRG